MAEALAKFHIYPYTHLVAANLQALDVGKHEYGQRYEGWGSTRLKACVRQGHIFGSDLDPKHVS